MAVTEIYTRNSNASDPPGSQFRGFRRGLLLFPPKKCALHTAGARQAAPAIFESYFSTVVTLRFKGIYIPFMVSECH